MTLLAGLALFVIGWGGGELLGAWWVRRAKNRDTRAEVRELKAQVQMKNEALHSAADSFQKVADGYKQHIAEQHRRATLQQITDRYAQSVEYGHDIVNWQGQVVRTFR